MDVWLFIVWFILKGQESTLMKIMTAGVGFLLHIVGALMAWDILQWIGNKVNWKENKLFMTLSKNSMPMYLFHHQLIYYTIIALNGKVSPWSNTGANVVFAIIGSLLISMVLMHWKTTRILVGENEFLREKRIEVTHERNRSLRRSWNPSLSTNNGNEQTALTCV